MPVVNDYSFGRIVIDGKTYTHDVILFWDGRIIDWWRKEGHSVCLDDVREVIEAKPEVVVFGTGKYGVMKVGDEVKNVLKREGIDCIEAISDEAVRIFNELSGRKVLAIHLTC